MRLSLGQHLQLQQKQILAPRMIQSMEILQLPIMALQERIEQEMEENPVLEIKDEEADAEVSLEAGADAESPDAESPDAPSEEERELVIDEAQNNEEDFERLLNMDEQWPDHFEERSHPSSNRVDEAGERKHDAMANMAARPQSLHDYLHDQLGWFDLKPELRAMADRIIYNLDANGYMPGSLQDLLGVDATDEDLALAQKALGLVQKLDPPGIAARSLQECLLMQLVAGMPFYEQLKTLISNHLEDLEHNRLPAISSRTGYGIELVKQTLEELRKLNPKPGAIFGETPVAPVTPDVFVDVQENGQYKVRMEETNTPKLFISPYYRKLITSGKANEETREYIKRKVNSAQWLIDSIQQRRGTLSRVSQAIVDHQTRFLAKGPEFIEPLKMQQIADKVGVHVTTVSRAVDDKWIQTSRGIFPLKRFFCGGTIREDGEEVAWDKVRLKLQEVIDQEDKQSPLSDDALKAELATHGITVARRTVTKYRKAMKIPSSRQRREWKS
jgi:RNA polymerase sigma-54 factor